jgi:exodeoxyribonuclease V beta subunit
VRRHVDIGDEAVAVHGLVRAISTPLGPLVGGIALRDIAIDDRMDEMGFELPLVGGSTPTGGVSVGDIGAVLRGHVQPGDPLDGYPDKLSDPVFGREVRGYLTGSIDAVLRTPAGLAVVDYKTNWLGVDDEPLSAWHYTPTAVAAAMQRAHYPLQALLYTVALHRYLRWRMPGYAPDDDLAGVLYLFVRGMTGPDVPHVDGQPCGVFAWRPPTDLIVDLSDLLDHGAVAA